MIRLVHLLRRRPGLSLEEFNAWWRDEHGPRVSAHQSRLGIVRYVQTYRGRATEEVETLARSKRGCMEPPYDGVSEFWFQSEASLAEARACRSGRAAETELIADAGAFADLAASPLFLGHEYPQVSILAGRAVARPKTGVIKVVFALAPPARQSAKDAQLYWRTVHGPLVRSHAIARGTLFYQQVHRFESALSQELQTLHGAPVNDYIGHAEAWFDRLAPRAGVEAADAEAAALADEPNFIDWARSSLLIGKERVFIERDWL